MLWKDIAYTLYRDMQMCISERLSYRVNGNTEINCPHFRVFVETGKFLVLLFPKQSLMEFSVSFFIFSLMQQYLSAYYCLHSCRQINVTLIRRAKKALTEICIKLVEQCMETVRLQSEPVIEHLVKKCSHLGVQVQFSHVGSPLTNLIYGLSAKREVSLFGDHLLWIVW